MKRYVNRPLVYWGSLVLILLIGFGLRFWDFPARIALDTDSTRDALVAINGARTFQLPLLGPFSSVGAFTFGPWYYYLLIFFELLYPLSYASWVFMGVISTATIVVMYGLGRLLFGHWAGVLAAAITAVLPRQVGMVLNVTNPNMIGFFTALSLYLFVYILSKKASKIWYVAFGAMLSIGVSMHYQMAGLAISLLAIATIVRWRNISLLLHMYIAAMAVWIPLLVFELTNHWYMVRNMLHFVTKGKDLFYVPNSWTLYLGTFWPEFISYLFGEVNRTLGIAIACILVISLVLALTRAGYRSTYSILLFSFVLLFFMLRYYWGERFMGYLQFFHPYLIVCITGGVWALKKPLAQCIAGFGILAGVVVLSCPTLIFLLQPNSSTAYAVDAVEKLKQRYPDEQFVLYSCQNNYRFRVQAMAYLLEEQRMLGEGGRHLAFIAGKCLNPATMQSQPDDQLGEEAGVITIRHGKESLPSVAVLDISAIDQATKSALSQMGWGRYDAATVWEDVVRWYYRIDTR